MSSTKSTFRTKETRTMWVFVAPAIIILLGTSVFPLLYSLVLSTFSWDMTVPYSVPKFVGFANYIHDFVDASFTESLVRSVLYVVVSVSIEFVIGMAIALMITSKLRALPIYRVTLLLPLMMSPVVAGVLWRFLFNPEYGVIDFFVGLFGGHPVTWLARGNTAFASLIMVEVWQQLPVVIFVLAAGITGLPENIFESADIDGASGLQKFRYLTLPLLRPVIAVVLLLRIMDCFKVFGNVYALTYGGPGSSTELLSLYIYKQGLKFFQIGHASSVSWLFLLIVFFVSFFFMRQLWREQPY